MARGIHFWPIAPVWIGQVDDIPFEFFEDGEQMDLTGATAKCAAEFNKVSKFSADLTATDEATGKFFLPAADLFDEEGDWEVIIAFTRLGSVFFSERFIFQVQTPVGG